MDHTDDCDAMPFDGMAGVLAQVLITRDLSCVYKHIRVAKQVTNAASEQ